MVCRNCGKEFGGRYDCPACGYDPTKDDPDVRRSEDQASAIENVLPPVEIVLRKKANVPAILGFVCSILMCIPIPLVGIITCPVLYIAAVILTALGFAKVKSCRSGRGFSIPALILCILLPLVIIAFIVIALALGGAGLLVEIAAVIFSVLGTQSY